VIGTPEQLRFQHDLYVNAGYRKFAPTLLPNILAEVGGVMELFSKNVMQK
jgi:hypothetical protein